MISVGTPLSDLSFLKTVSVLHCRRFVLKCVCAHFLSLSFHIFFYSFV